MNTELIRRCPACGAENPPQSMRCGCGMILAGVDIVTRHVATPEKPQAEEAGAALPVVCFFEDCAQENPPGSTICLYCNRPIEGVIVPTPSASLQSLVNLPAALKERYRIISPMPTRGAEAELLIVQAVAGGANLVAKIYRHGIVPRADVQARINKIPVAHRVEVFEVGVSDGYAYELMELCERGSLRHMMDGGALAPEILQSVIAELATALHDVHAAGLVHRDLKPENVLIRSLQPLDLVLTDFSISSILDVTQRFTGVARTLPYAAPESLSGVIDFKSDFWAMGMIVLEGSTGKHPYAGLSEAVVMHHLTTRNIDLIEVSDRNVRKLLLGLLQRDPALRWGADEIERWLNNDPCLAEPAEPGAVKGFNEPYHIAREVCYKPEQLAVALARHWKEGVADISNGQLLTWFRDVQKDQNVVRLLLDMRSPGNGQGNLSVHLQLLRLILHLAPGIPPVWQGETIALSTILTYANQSLNGDQAAARWLDNLYQFRVLEFYAEAGNLQAADLVKRWHHALDLFDSAWTAKLAIISQKSAARDPEVLADFDQLMYGRDDLQRPGLVDMHARLLAMSYDPSWSERLRRRVLAELLSLSSRCAWVADLGDPLQMDAASLLVLEALLPEAKKSVEHQLKKMARDLDQSDREYAALREDISTVLDHLRSTASSGLATPAVCDDLRAHIEHYMQLIVAIRASSRGDQDWLDFKKQALRSQVAANRMLEKLDELARHRAISAGWFTLETAGFVVLGLFVLPVLFPGIGLWLILTIIVLVAWRLLPDYLMMKSIQELAVLF